MFLLWTRCATLFSDICPVIPVCSFRLNAWTVCLLITWCRALLVVTLRRYSLMLVLPWCRVLYREKTPPSTLSRVEKLRKMMNNFPTEPLAPVGEEMEGGLP